MKTTDGNRLLLWAAIGAVAAVLSACGGSGAPEESEAAGTTTAAASSSETETEDTETEHSGTDHEGTESEDAQAPAADGPAIVIEGFGYGDPLTVAPGAVIQITNNDSAEHSVTSDTEGVFDVDVDGGESGTLTAPTEPGEYTYFCKYHPSMTGTLIVQ